MPIPSGHCQDFTFPERKVNIPQSFASRAISQSQLPNLQNFRARFTIGPLQTRTYIASNQHTSQVPSGCTRDQRFSCDFSVTEDYHFFAEIEHLSELVGDKDDASPLFGDPPQDVQQTVNLRRTQIRSGLVEDQNVRSTYNRLHVFTPLPTPHQ